MVATHHIGFPLFIFTFLFLFCLINIPIAYYLLHRHYKRKRYLELKVGELQEKINIINNENNEESKNRIALEQKIKRYNSLKDIIEEINRNLDLESIAESLTSIAFSLIAGNKGTCNLYLIDKQTRVNLSLFKTRKEDKKLIIKAKQGDIFDLWVLRHTSPLLIEDIRRDFRFDLEKIETQYTRPVSSLISSPLISEQRFLGILRLDNTLPGFYSQDDLRLLVTICDLGAIALEDSELFQRTEDLAIHDELTGLHTKKYFLERLEEECRRSIRQRAAFSLLMLDIDYFKNYNDKFGHMSGDIVLRNLSRDIADFLKDKSAMISRFGGEEFCIILPSMDKAGAIAVADELRIKIERTKIILRKLETDIRVSIGVAAFPSDAGDAAGLVLKADQAMYKAKQKGRNRVCGI